MARSKSKKMTFNMLNELVPTYEPVEINVGENSELTLTVKRTLDFTEAMSFVRSVADSCFDENGEYLPEVFDFAMAINVMMYYAGVSMPTDFKKAYNVIMCSNIYDEVLAVIDEEQLYKLENDAMRRVVYRRDSNIQSNSNRINELIAAVDRMIADSQRTMDELNSDEFSKRMEDVLRLVAPGVQQNAGLIVGEPIDTNIAENASEVDHDNIIVLKHEDK